jgi:hypothetical protein
VLDFSLKEWLTSSLSSKCRAGRSNRSKHGGRLSWLQGMQNRAWPTQPTGASGGADRTRVGVLRRRGGTERSARTTGTASLTATQNGTSGAFDRRVRWHGTESGPLGRGCPMAAARGRATAGQSFGRGYARTFRTPWSTIRLVDVPCCASTWRARPDDLSSDGTNPAWSECRSTWIEMPCGRIRMMMEWCGLISDNSGLRVRRADDGREGRGAGTSRLRGSGA